MVKKKNACVFISGKGTNLKNLIFKSREYNFPINIKLVVTNKNADGIIYARKNSIPLLFVNTKSRYYENTILNALKRYNIHIICLSGYMKILPNTFLKNLERKLLIFILPYYQNLKV